MQTFMPLQCRNNRFRVLGKSVVGPQQILVDVGEPDILVGDVTLAHQVEKQRTAADERLEVLSEV